MVYSLVNFLYHTFIWTGSKKTIQIIKACIYNTNSYCTDPVEDLGPPLQGHALEHRQHRQDKVVEVRDS